MISKPLFKQSCKANLGIWSFVTFITCLMLAIIIVVIGNMNVGGIRDSMVDIFVSNAIESSVKKQSMTYFNLTEEALDELDAEVSALQTLLTGSNGKDILNEYKSLTDEGKSDAEAREALKQSYDENEINAVIDYYLECGEDFEATTIQNYTILQIADKIYDSLVETEGEETAKLAKRFLDQAMKDFIAESESSNANEFATYYIPRVLKTIFVGQSIDYQGRTITVRDYFSADEIEEFSLSSIISYKAQVAVKRDQLREQLKNENPTLGPEQIEQMVESQIGQYELEIINSLSGSLLEDLPEDIAQALAELGALDISDLIIGSMFFKMAGILLPIVYIIMVSSNLISAQVDSGSMAYILSTPTKRKTVIVTQMCYLIFSLFAMFLCTTVVGLVALTFVSSTTVTLSYLEMILLNIGAFITMIAISGICFLFSSIFNRNKLAMSIGGGISMFFLVTTILGLFGSPAVPSAMRIDSMNFFNYFSIITLFDNISILAGTLTYLWKLAILLAVGIGCYLSSIFIFKKKDLPL